MAISLLSPRSPLHPIGSHHVKGGRGQGNNEPRHRIRSYDGRRGIRLQSIHVATWQETEFHVKQPLLAFQSTASISDQFLPLDPITRWQGTRILTGFSRWPIQQLSMPLVGQFAEPIVHKKSFHHRVCATALTRPAVETDCRLIAVKVWTAGIRVVFHRSIPRAAQRLRSINRRGHEGNSGGGRRRIMIEIDSRKGIVVSAKEKLSNRGWNPHSNHLSKCFIALTNPFQRRCLMFLLPHERIDFQCKP